MKLTFFFHFNKHFILIHLLKSMFSYTCIREECDKICFFFFTVSLDSSLSPQCFNCVVQTGDQSQTTFLSHSNILFSINTSLCMIHLLKSMLSYTCIRVECDKICSFFFFFIVSLGSCLSPQCFNCVLQMGD